MIKWLALLFFIWFVISHFYNRLTEEPADD